MKDSSTNFDVFIDQKNLVEYIFMGWDAPLSIEEKLALIAKDPRKRKSPIGPLFEDDKVLIEDPHPQFERKIIVRAEEEAEEQV